MNTRVIGLVASLAFAAGCTPAVSSGSGSSTSSALDGNDGSPDVTTLTDAEYVSQYYGEGVHLTSRGVIKAEWNHRYSDTLTYDMPQAGTTLTGYDLSSPDLNIPDGSYVDLALFTLHKDADQVGSLVVDTGDNEVAVRLARRDVGSSTVIVSEFNGQPWDSGNTTVACDYNIAILPGGSLAGQGVHSFSKIKMEFQPY